MARPAAFILAGGESSRMGRNKALLEIDGEPLIVRTARTVEESVAKPAIVGPREIFETFGFDCIEDGWPGAGPLGGIATALRAAAAGWSLVVACDLPYLTGEWLGYLTRRAQSSSADAVIPESEFGVEPLCALYNKHADEPLRAALERGVRKVTEGLATLSIEKIEPAEWKPFDSGGHLFKNMNTPPDYEEARTRLSGRTNR